MHILVYEYLTGGGEKGALSPAMTLEGEHMLRGLVSDLLSIPEVTLTVVRDDRLPPIDLQNRRLRIQPIAPSESPLALLREHHHHVDAVWPIAPETNGCLETICREIEAEGKTLLSTSSEGVALMGRKLETLRVLEHAGVPVVASAWLENIGDWQTFAYPLIFKRNDGAGCEDTIIIQNTAEKDAFLKTHTLQNWIAQPLVEGDALSLSGLFCKGRGQLLSCNRQQMVRDHQGFYLSGITVNAIQDVTGLFRSLLSQVASALPALWGFAGIDFVLDHTGPKVLEVNPRLTSAYAGIRAATGLNPAAMVLDLAKSSTLPSLTPPGMKPVELRWGLA